MSEQKSEAYSKTVDYYVRRIQEKLDPIKKDIEKGVLISSSSDEDLRRGATVWYDGLEKKIDNLAKQMYRELGAAILAMPEGERSGLLEEIWGKTFNPLRDAAYEKFLTYSR